MMAFYKYHLALMSVNGLYQLIEEREDKEDILHW